MSCVLVEIFTESIVKITLNRPEKKNALTQSMYAELLEAFQQAQGADNIKGVWLTGAQGDFTAGNDLTDFAAAQSPEDLSAVLAFLQFLPTFTKLLIISIEGVAVGIGATLLLHADFVYATDEAFIQLPFTKLGLCPEAGSTALLPQTIGRAASSPLLYLGKPLSGQLAFQLGLLTEVFDTSERMGEVLTKLCDEISHIDSAALQETKRLVNDAQGTLSSTIDKECQSFMKLLMRPGFASKVPVRN
jgi:enoyl-CoA hydratase/carnithine racemase